MVGLVVVSHSRVLARAAIALAQEMLHGRKVRIAMAAGLDDATFGTDAQQIVNAITEADQGSGVVVLMDLGSAVLSAELALDLLDDEMRTRVVLCPAPLVEGLIVAAVAASGGATSEEIAAEANGALAGKMSQLGAAELPPRSGDAHVDASSRAPGELSGMFEVTPPHGLHARPASRVVQEVRTLDATVELRNVTTQSGWIPASSLSKVATLGALHGHQVEIRATGHQAREAVEHLLTLAARNFDEPAARPPASEPDTSGDHAYLGEGTPTPASAGIGFGPAWSLHSVPVVIPNVRSEDPTTEWRRLREALAVARRDVQHVRARAVREVGETDAAIFEAHLLLLDDADLLAGVRTRVQEGETAATAWSRAIARITDDLESLPDPYLQARAADVRAVGDSVLRALVGASSQLVSSPGVLVAADLTPAEAAALEPSMVRAVVLAFGSPTGHNVILLRARGIPAVVGAGPSVLAIPDGTPMAVDGIAGEVVVDPSPEVIHVLRERADHFRQRSREAFARASESARTRDGVEVLVGANVATVEDAWQAADLGADLAGLVRTEFLFLQRDQPPDVDEQEAAYRKVAEALAGRRITLRTLDVGGDKPLPYVAMTPEANPFLGIRGIRLSLSEPKLLADQLLAIVRTAHDWPVSVMFPMVTTLDELVATRQLLDEAIRTEGRGVPPDLHIGIMVETPATALKTGVFAPHVDFLSIGTNDLTQYALAAERGNAAVAGVGDSYDPGVLRLIEAICRDARDRIPVAVCGEMAADPAAAALLVGLGARELSVAPRAIPTIKQAIRVVDSQDAVALAAAALRAPSAPSVRDLLTRSS